MSPGTTCVECTGPAKGWFVDVVTGDTFCGLHGRDRPSADPYRSPGTVASAIRRRGPA